MNEQSNLRHLYILLKQKSLRWYGILRKQMEEPQRQNDRFITRRLFTARIMWQVSASIFGNHPAHVYNLTTDSRSHILFYGNLLT